MPLSKPLKTPEKYQENPRSGRRRGRWRPPPPPHQTPEPEHGDQIVGRHLDRLGQAQSLRRRRVRHCVQVAHPPGRVAGVQALIEAFIRRRRVPAVPGGLQCYM